MGRYNRGIEIEKINKITNVRSKLIQESERDVMCYK